MSVFRTVSVACPACAGEVDFELVHSVNADRSPYLRDDILKANFQLQTCPGCGLEFRMDPEFNYLDLGRSQWIAALPHAAIAGWAASVAAARENFDESWGRGASEGARGLGSTLQARVTFGWAALREKLVIRDAGLDDVTVELAKMALIRDARTPPLMSAELRLLDIEGEELLFGWLDTGDEGVVEFNRVNRALLAELEGDSEWDELRRQLSAELFVDVKRLFMAPAAAAPA